MARNRALLDLEALTELFPHRVARAAELIALGMTSRAVYGRCLPGGPWQRIAPGVILLSNAPPTRRQLIASALRHAGPKAVVSGWDAVGLYDIATPGQPGPVHLLVPHNRQVRSAEHILIERTIKMPIPMLLRGFPVAPLCRAAIDTARRLQSTDQVRALLGEVTQRGRISPAALRHELETGSNRGSALPRLVLEEVSNGIRSVAEAWARKLVLRSRLPRPQWNVPVHAPDGELLGIIDAWWDEVGLAWEIDSYQFHLSPQSYARTMRRSSRLTAAGIIVVHTLPARLRDEPVTVLDELSRAHQHAAGRPRPPVIAKAS